ncbi:Condensin-2 complex subunit D3 [Portunus trituberculatus]|uniref:Condensin-2 complex subunit D3 n=1 Tax=Portunus trituberculatus TaxID=210409 RepID=A0A5B7HHE8_PORTR|nr:Condensin-2 complex subunit D3 [Portunus trituberculatus]
MADAAGRMQQVLELLSKFSLNSLDSDWTKSVIDADFTEVGDLPSNFEDHHFSTNLSGLFSAVNNSFRHWVDLLPNLTDDNHKMSTSTLAAEDDDDSLHTRFWTELSDDLKKLMTLLFYYCYRGQRYDAREAEREFGIQAASLYFLVLCVPGSNAFRVFHPVMYRKCMETMRLATKLQVGAANPKKGRHSTAVRASQRRHQEDQMNTEAEEEEESELTMLTPSEATKLVRSLNILLHDFLRLTLRFSLKHSPDSLDETISILMEVSCSETNNASGIFVERHGPATTTALAYNSYCSLQSLCCNIHGQRKKIVMLIMKHILHNILMVPRGLSDLSGRSLNVIREHSQIFVKYILMQVKEEAYDGVYILIQHLCLQVPDKAEFRQKAAQSVVEILRFLPTHLYVRLIKWFFKFSHNEKAGHRLFMLEVMCSFPIVS